MKRSFFSIRMAVVGLVLLFALSSCNTAEPIKNSQTEVKTEFSKVDDSQTSAVIQNDTLMLSVDAENGELVVTDLRNGKQYMSTSEKVLENNWVTGPSRPAFLSQISINVIDKLGSLSTVYSYNSAVKKEGFNLYSAQGALCAEYNFVNEGVCLCVEYRLDDDQLIINIPTDKISVTGEYELADIGVLPYFGAATPEDDGQLLVPSGSGVLINFNNGKGRYGEFEQKVYGNDAMNLMEYRTEQGELILFPMYSMMYDNSSSALIAYVENGAALATLKASTTDESSSLTTASFSFNYHPYTLVNPLNTDSQSVKYNQFTRDKSNIEAFTLSYQFFDEEKNYFDIATNVRERLIKNGVTAQKDALTNKLYLEMLMGVRKTVYTAGIPHKTCYGLTTLSQASQIIDDFGNIPIVMILKGIDNDGVYGGEIDTSFSINSKIGTKKEYEVLVKKLKTGNGELYSVVNSTEFTKSTLKYSTLFHSARSVTGKNIKLYRYRYGDGQQNTDIEPISLLNYTKISSSVERFIKSAIKNKVSAVAPLSLSNSPYTCNTDLGDRNQVFGTFKNALASYNNANIKVLLEAPVDALIQYADDIYALPVSSGKHKIFDEDVPFVQLALNGLINYSTPAINQNDGDMVFLKALESGSSFALSLYAAEFDDIYDTSLKNYVSSEYGVQRESLINRINKYRSVIDEFDGCAITGHTIISKNIHCVDYDNGKTVVVNFGDSDYKYEDYEIERMSYLVLQSGGGSNA